MIFGAFYLDFETPTWSASNGHRKAMRSTKKYILMPRSRDSEKTMLNIWQQLRPVTSAWGSWQHKVREGWGEGEEATHSSAIVNELDRVGVEKRTRLHFMNLQTTACCKMLLWSSLKEHKGMGIGKMLPCIVHSFCQSLGKDNVMIIIIVTNKILIIKERVSGKWCHILCIAFVSPFQRY